MGILDNPKSLLGIRCIQLGIGIGFLVVLAYSNTHKGNWVHLEGPVALGVVSFFFALAVSIHGIFVHVKNKSNSKLIGIARIVLDFLIFLMWIGTTTLMLRPRERDFTKGIDSPDVPWTIGIVFAIIEVVAFLITTVLLGFELRNYGGASTSASYV